jgi:hypothetical protein
VHDVQSVVNATRETNESSLVAVQETDPDVSSRLAGGGHHGLAPHDRGLSQGKARNRDRPRADLGRRVGSYLSGMTPAGQEMGGRRHTGAHRTKRAVNTAPAGLRQWMARDKPAQAPQGIHGKQVMERQ